MTQYTVLSCKHCFSKKEEEAPQIVSSHFTPRQPLLPGERAHLSLMFGFLSRRSCCERASHELLTTLQQQATADPAGYTCINISAAHYFRSGGHHADGETASTQHTLTRVPRAHCFPLGPFLSSYLHTAHTIFTSLD